MDQEFIKNYLEYYAKLVLPTSEIISALSMIKDTLVKSSENGTKAIIVGNGGSAAIASHFSVDITKNTGIRCTNFNDSGLITCFANDYGYGNWVEKAIDCYGDSGDIFIAISSSGRSENILNGIKAAKRKKFSSLITFSGFDENNPLRSQGDINLWIDSKIYNFVESVHQIWLLTVIDLIQEKLKVKC